ncbi:hypothetical protein BPAE_0159g00280 [Botrytis paeoniae]|uniref:Uncharacterized protein n=1 Tax=Botrytis paeoniae TaxID=278948 RepID=A0A4Z1FMC7_9HELO|nr:hypothetical protein BPAE_0159g00280 [Botrytis paeoniae]
MLKNPAIVQTLKSEIAAAHRAGLPSQPPTWKGTQSLHYLDACIMEAQRIHSLVGLHLERFVPKEGAAICGKYMQAVTIVGVNAWIVHTDTGTFGDDINVWRPEI